jgi:hypothetical protein
MSFLLNLPRLVLALSLVVLWFSEWIGVSCRRRWSLKEEQRDDFSLIVSATLTLLGLIIGFTFSMAISRYDQRKDYEEAEANAIGTEYVRADFLPAADAAKVRALLVDYLDQRILFYETRGDGQLRQLNATTGHLEAELWSAVRTPAAAQSSPVIALAVSGMNDVLNSQGYTQAAWWNRIPGSAWGLMAAIAICSNGLIGYGMRSAKANASLLLVLPLVVSISFFLIADIDSPNRGMIRVSPQNLISLAQSLQAH